ncbi:MAG: EmrB/QacA family drug resistance transporter [Novosphingobium sp. 17-62-19]|nr:MAG: EmrB/QacA family drug resistance transporter [Novosphingobium sp. 35-62-5]OZA20016.1 MAG: EmrB/QacA family drug resistance transporter [Novosphingobium sp. 17-62-19]
MSANSMANSAAEAADTPPIVSRNRTLMLIGTMAAMVMYTLDTTIANVALPHMTASLSATQDTITWVLTSYVLASAVALPLAGWLVDRLGIRMMMLASVLLFTIASMLCGIAQSLEQMVLFRVLQGLAGAFLSPLAQTVTLDSSTAAERPRMMGIYTQGVMLGPITGPIIGGYLTDNFSWRWVFYVNLPVGLLCFALLFLYLPRTPTRARKVDLTGWFLVAITVSAVQLILDRGLTLDWFASAEIVTYAVLALSAGWLAAFHLSGARQPLFPTAMFRDRNFTVGLAFMFLIGLVMMSVMALLPGLLQQIYGYTPMQAGMLLAPRGIGMLASIMLFGRYMAKMDPRLLLAFGLLLMAASMWMMTGWSIEMPHGPIIAAGLLQGLGLSFTFMPMNLISFATLPAQYRTDASSLANLMRNLGSSIGISAASVELARNIQINHAELGAHITRTIAPFNLDQITAYGDAGEVGLRIIDGMVNQQAAMIAYINDFYAMAVACLAAIPLLFLVRTAKRAP